MPIPGLSKMLVRTLALFALLAFSVPMIAAGEPNPKTDGNQDEAPVSPSKLYEAVSAYLDGYHKGTPSSRKRNPGVQKRGTPTGAAEDTSRREKFEAEHRLAELRLQRHEWDFAALSLERALKNFVVSATPDEKDQLQKLLQDTKRSSVNAAEQTTAPGEIINSLGMRMVAIRPGTFMMGSSPAEIRRIQNDWAVEESVIQSESPAHKVRITRPFLMGKYEVTVGQFKKFVSETGYRTVAEKQGWGWVYDDSKKHWTKKSGASWRTTGTQEWDDHPVTLVSHADAEAFCEWLSKREGRPYSLPTEAQWEYAARGGKQSERFPWGNDYPDGRKLNIADRNARVPWADRTVDDGYGEVSPVGSYEPNGFWLYDMMGNVWEACSDYYDPKLYESRSNQSVFDPTGPATGKTKVVRGGNWAFDAGIARNAFRFGADRELCTDMSGFRVSAIASAAELSQAKTADENVLSNENFKLLLEKVKNMVASGKRLEARRFVEDMAGSKNAKSNPDDSVFFVKNALTSLIDLASDKGTQSFKNSLSMNMVRIPAGSFVMGSSETDIAWAMTTLAQGQPISLENEFPFHKVRISRPFYISATEVTVAQFKAFVDETGYITDAEDEKGGQVFNSRNRRFEKKDGSSWKDPGWTITRDQPVTMISYNDAQAFVEWLAAKEKLPYKLPTEAQWEYAARGGLPMSVFPWGDQLPDGQRANYADKSTDYEWRDRTADDGHKFVSPVGSYEPNGYGLYDMAGNVLEWVRDYYGEDYYRFSPEIDPEGPGHGEFRAMKGGEWTFGAVNLRCAFRGWARPESSFQNSGFRVVIELGNPVRLFHFSSDFLTKEWVPGQDQRAAATAVAKEKERSKQPVRASVTEKPKPSQEPGVKGLLVLNFSPKSDARKSGLSKGDVIIEYDGARDLTVDRFLAMTAITKRERTRPLLVFVRDGYEYSIHANPGFLGISLMDTVIRGPFKRPESRPEPSIESDRDKKSKAPDWT